MRRTIGSDPVPAPSTVPFGHCSRMGIRRTAPRINQRAIVMRVW